MKTSIYYFTGTGNSYYIAKQLCSFIEDSDCISIINMLKNQKTLCKSENVGIVFPLYCGGLPKIVLRFLENITFKNKPYVFAIATRGASSGFCMKQISDILNKKGVKLNYSDYVTMPNNYVKMFNMKTEESNKKIINLADKDIKYIIENIKKRKNNKVIISIKNRFVIPIYKIFINKTNKLDKGFYINSNCNSCGMCKSICPVNNIDFINKQPIWKHKCEQCIACIQYCPMRAIQLNKKTEIRLRYRNPYININEVVINREDENI